jgi:hypothetical protein
MSEKQERKKSQARQEKERSRSRTYEGEKSDEKIKKRIVVCELPFEIGDVLVTDESDHIFAVLK